MAADSTVVLNVITKTEQALRDIDKFTRQTLKSLTGLEKQFSFLSRSAASFVGNLGANIATKALSEVTGAVKGLVDVVTVDAVNASIGYQDSLNQLQTSLELTGKASESTLKSFEDFASRIQATTKFSDDAVLSSAAYIQSIGNLTPEALKKATKASIDFAAATGKDVRTTTELVAKAAAGQVELFSRYGIVVKKGATDTESFNNALKALEKFTGASEKTVNTLSGALTQNRNAFDDVLKTIGNLIVKSPGVVGALKGVNQVLVNASSALGEAFKGEDPFKQLILSTLDLATTINSILTPTFLALRGVVGVIFNSIKTLLVGISQPVFVLISVIQNLGNALGIISDEAVRIAKAQRDVVTRGVIDSAKATLSSLGDIVDNNDLTGKIEKQIDVIRKSTEKQLLALPEIANKASNGTSNALKPLSDKVIEIGLKIGNPEAIAAARAKFIAEDKKFAEEVTAQRQALLVSQLQTGQITELEFQNSTFLLKRQAEQLEKEAQLQSELEFQQKQLDAQAQFQATRQNIDLDVASNKLLLQQQALEQELKLEAENTVKYEALQKKKAEIDRKLSKERLNQASQFFGDLSSLTQTGNKDLFEIGKAASLANAIVQGALAIQNALAVQPFPVGLALAAAASVKTAVNIATISAQTLARGTGFVEGGVSGKDSVPALLMPGERVVSTSTNKDLTEFLKASETTKDSQQLGVISEILGGIMDRLGSLENTTIVNIGNKEIVREVREGLRAGRQLVTT